MLKSRNTKSYYFLRKFTFHTITSKYNRYNRIITRLYGNRRK